MERSWFFNNGDPYGQDELRKYFTHIYRNGIAIDDMGSMELNVSASGNAVNVESGFGIIGGFGYENDSDVLIQVTADGNYDRIDRVVLRLDVTAMTIRLALKKGIAGSSPKPPDLQRDGLIYELSLAQVRITPSGGMKITDERFSQELCGAIRPRDMTEYQAMIKEYEKQFTEWFNAQQAKGWRNIFIQENNPEEAVSGNIWM